MNRDFSQNSTDSFDETILLIRTIFTVQIITDSQRRTIAIVICVFICGFISVFGSITNVINLIVYYKQGLTTTINISFFSLAISDLNGLIFQQLFNLYINPGFEELNLPMVYTDLQYITTAIEQKIFSKITCLITVYITAERCLCIVFPLHVKQIITPRRTTTVIVCIYTVTIVTVAPAFSISYVDWKFFPDRNQTLLALVFTTQRDAVEGVLYFAHAIFGIVSFFAVVLLTCILIFKLEQKNNWRKSASVKNEKSESLSSKDKATMFMVILIAGVLIICYTPSVVLLSTTFFVPEFSVRGSYYNMYYSFWTIAILLENVNSSANIFLYYKMSTKYRLTFNKLFFKCKTSKTNSVLTSQSGII